MKYIIPTIALLLVFSCNEIQIKTSIDKDKIVESINQLETSESQRTFLENIYEIDQSTRKNSIVLEKEYGYGSKKVTEAVQKTMEADKENRFKIETYIKKWGYPTLDDHGKEAVGTPYIVWHHADLARRTKNFPHLYKSYKKGDTSIDAVSFYLGRSYYFTYGHNMRWDRPFSPREELDSLIKHLYLKEICDELDQEFD